MATIISGLRYLTWLLNVFAALSATVMAGLVVLGTVMRYVVGTPLMISNELAGLLFVSMAFLAIPHVLLKRRQITVDIVVRCIPYPWRRLIDVLAIFIFFAFAIIFIYEAYDYAAFSYQISARSSIGELLLWPWMMLIPVSLAIGVLVALVQLIDSLRAFTGHPPYLPENSPETDEIIARKQL